jgi:hypothetical protein
MRLVIALALLPLGGCVSAPIGHWHKTDTGQRVDATDAIFAVYQRDVAICDGEAAKAALASNEKIAKVHRQNVNLVFDGCMVERGYFRR